MNNQNELNNQTNRDISIKRGTYNENIKGNYIDNSSHVYMPSKTEGQTWPNILFKLVNLINFKIVSIFIFLSVVVGIIFPSNNQSIQIKNGSKGDGIRQETNNNFNSNKSIVIDEKSEGANIIQK